jgi:C1A family cysteine protease
MKFAWALGLAFACAGVTGLSAESIQIHDGKNNSQSHLQATYTTRRQPSHAKGLVRTEETRRLLKSFQFGAPPVYWLVTGKLDISSKVSLPRNQGGCGDCWAYSLVKALQSELMLAGTSPSSLLDVEYLTGNCGGSDRENGCGGGDFPAAANLVTPNGAPANGRDPAGGGRCPSGPVAGSALSYQMLGGDNGPTFQDLAAWVSGAADGYYHMVSIDVAAGAGDWENYSDGIYNGCSGGSGDIDHMIDLVGYDCGTSVDTYGNCLFDSTGRAANHDEKLLVENNWGEDWGTKAANGHGGYMWTAMYDSQGRKCNAVATDALVFAVKHPVPSIEARR